MVGRDRGGVSGGNVRQGVVVAGLTAGIDEPRDVVEAAGDAPVTRKVSAAFGVAADGELAGAARRTAPRNVRMKRPRQAQRVGASVRLSAPHPNLTGRRDLIPIPLCDNGSTAFGN